MVPPSFDLRSTWELIMPSTFDIVVHTPLWVWPLLILVLWLGWSSSRPRTVHPLRLAALPLVGLGMTIAGAVQSAAPLVTLAGWLVGLLITLPIGRLIGRRRSVTWQPEGRIRIDGGWFMLGFAVSIFAVRYALGVTFGMWPALATQPDWIAGAGALGGAVAGIGLGWLSGLLVRDRRWLGRAMIAGATLPLVACAGLAAVIAFDEPAPIQRLAAGDSLPGADKWNWQALPQPSRVTARDGAPLAYRLYPGRANRVVVLVHGSSGSGVSMHRLAMELQAAGATVYAISLRGHGGSGTAVGDSSYQNQLDDDLVDFVRAVGLDKRGIHRTLIGFSSGGGFVLRTAGGPNAAMFDAYLPISPYVAYNSPTSRPAAGGWASVALPRFIALSVLDGFGLPWFQNLVVVRFATDAKPSVNRTPAYSWRLQVGMHLPRNWRQEIAGISQPTIVAVGSDDELFRSDQFAPLFAELNPKIPVTVVPGLGHMDMISNDRAASVVAELWQKLVAAGRFDFKVREDMFAGFDGDKGAFSRAMTLIADTLAHDPDNAEALTWRGAGRLFMAGEAFGRQATREGMALASQGVADLERGVALKPDSIGARAARGPALLVFTKGLRAFDKSEADRLTGLAIGDFDYILKANAANWGRLAEHDRGELLGALADGWLQLGEADKADPYLERMTRELPGTPYAQNAAQHRAERSAKAPLTCLGCH